MNDALLIGFNVGFKIVIALAALWAVNTYLTRLNAKLGFDFGNWLAEGDDDTTRTNPGYGIYLGLRFLGLCILLGSILGCGAEAATIPDRYDSTIKSASEQWMPGIPWQLWKAQLYQESRLEADAVSPVGALGVAQFMPATWREVSLAMKFPAATPASAVEPAILAGAYYMAQQRRIWRTVEDLDRHRLACASYNAGAGNIIWAKRKAGSTDWAAVSAALPEVTGKHALETQTYVKRIFHWFAVLSA